MRLCFFVSDIHGKIDKYEKLFKEIKTEKPEIVFFGGDLLPSGLAFNKTADKNFTDFINDYILKNFLEIKELLESDYPEIFLILGNDDPKIEESLLLKAEKSGAFKYMHNKKVKYKKYKIYGYANIPPTPFLLKDWERYDVSRYVDPGCVPPTEGYRTIKTNEDIEYATIQKDIEKLTDNDDLSHSVFLFHSPPYKTNLDRAALDGQIVDFVPLDVHVGSIAIKRFIEEKQPTVTLHGHVHESSQITGKWQQKIGKTFAFSAAYNGEELAIIKFDLNNPSVANRVLI